MKKKVLFAAMMLMVGVEFANAQIEDFQTDSYTYCDARSSNPNRVLIKQCDEIPSELVLPKSVTYNGITYTVIGVKDNAFYRDYKIKSLTIPDSFEVKSFAFAYSHYLEEIILGDCDLRSGCFMECPSIQKVYFTGNHFLIRNDSFKWSEGDLKQRGFYMISSIPPRMIGDLDESVYKQVTLYVPTNSIGKYKGDRFWGKFKIRGWDAKAFIEKRLKRE